MSGPPAVVVEGLRQTYGEVVAVNDVSFSIATGEVFTLVGPNGAGKTTTIECVQGLRAPERGVVRVLGLDPHRAGEAVRERIGAQLQDTVLPSQLRVGEAVRLFASFYRRRADLDRLLERVGCGQLRDAPLGRLSGGQRQRVYIALALVNEPEVVFLDELTTGLDPQARRAMWDLVRDVRDRGTTVFLTTHFMEEAERLSDRVAVIDRGRIVAIGAPAELVARHAPAREVILAVEGQVDVARFRDLRGVTSAELRSGSLVLTGTGDAIVGDAVALIAADGARVRDVRVREPTLEDTFLVLTGRAMRD